MRIFTICTLFFINFSVAIILAERPNIVIILTDDQGYADIGFNPYHSNEVSTPNMDALAKGGVIFRQAYISGYVCSPTRTGLMLGRYQQRVGVYSGGEGGKGFDPAIPIFPAFLPKEYAKTAIGKWHLGLDDDYPALKWAAVNRGFNEFYGFMGRGGHDYFRLSYSNESNEKFVHPLYRGKERIDDKGYLTDRLSDEAVAFIDRNKATPFFLYLAYNAVHAPPQVPQETLNRIKKENPDISEERAVLMAMLYHLDQGIGRVTKKLKDEHLFENTLLFFLTDNGGAKGMHADNTPLRGYKASFYEGGIRTPFIVSYPKKIAGGQIIDTPIISLDILPTVLDALDKTPPIPDFFDGKSLLPILYNKAAKHHETLFWSTGGEGSWAVRNGYWKLIFQQGKTELFDLKTDPSEQNNLAEKQTDIVAVITEKYENWICQMSDPLSGGSRFWHSKQEKNETEPELTQREKIRAERRAQKKSERSK